MCGRARCTLRADDYSRACHLNNARPVRHLNMDRYRPSYNVAPGFNVPVVRPDDEGDSNGVVLHCMKWGLIPSFTKKTEKIDHFRMFNARSESIREKASFRRLIPKNRCLVSFEGFYEWKKDGSRKQPYHIHFKDGRPMVFAALYDSWKNSEGEILYTFTIITTSSSSSLEWLHDRMPVILGDKESSDCWLNDSTLSNLDKILKPYEEKDLAWYPVTNAMGKISFDGPECIKEVKAESETKSISQFFSKKNVRAPEEPKHEDIPIKDETVEASKAKGVKKEPESQSTLESSKTKDEPVEDDSQQKSIKEEAESQDEYHNPGKGNPSVVDKRDYVQFSGDAKPFAKETVQQRTSPVRKRNKGADDKQPTLFSYFGRS
ncbi:putative peptidase ymr114c [Phtheirospermum japonicum]|uniref:Putative peptidase ymr114c n=1 Tax=Phtheirospermum japonicum TaxID=374723 RepID=A0A830CPI5_9LAMI|nr:putative peptidase ymr114c [Phtheirospermum japonicum]